MFVRSPDSTSSCIAHADAAIDEIHILRRMMIFFIELEYIYAYYFDNDCVGEEEENSCEKCVGDDSFSLVSTLFITPGCDVIVRTDDDKYDSDGPSHKEKEISHCH